MTKNDNEKIKASNMAPVPYFANFEIQFIEGSNNEFTEEHPAIYFDGALDMHEMCANARERARSEIANKWQRVFTLSWRYLVEPDRRGEDEDYENDPYWE